MHAAARGMLAMKPVLIVQPSVDHRRHLVLRDTAEVRKFVNSYTSDTRAFVSETLDDRAKYLPMIFQVFDREGIPRDLANIAFIESRYNPLANGAGTVGMWQFTTATARSLGLEVSLWNDERKNPVKSTEAAAKYFKRLYSQFDDWFLVAAAYNLGPAKIEAAIDKGESLDVFQLGRKGLICRDVINFVAKFIALSMITRNLDVYGFSADRHQYAG